MNFATLLLLTLSTATLVLRSGERITVQAPVHEQNGVVVFRAGGTLYSMPSSEVDLGATLEANAAAEDDTTGQPRKPIKVSAADRERLLKALEENHSGQPAPDQELLKPAALPAAAPAETKPSSDDEWRWRREARSYEEVLRQARENLNLLNERAERLRGEIRGLLSLGYKPRDFSYQTTQLVNVEEQIPYAQLEVERAQRAWDQFRDDARRQGVMPGWLR